MSVVTHGPLWSGGIDVHVHTVVVGGGIVGLAVARVLRARGHGVTVCEKEPVWAAHQSGHNSGVIHSGLYCRPGRRKARLCAAGAASMAAFARERGLPVDVGSKLVVAVHDGELPALGELARRGVANGVPVRWLDAAQGRDYEPEVRCVAALRLHTTRIIDFAAVCRVLAAELVRDGAELRLGTEVLGVHARARGYGCTLERGSAGRCPGQLRRAAQRPDRPAGRSGAQGADHPVPRRVLRTRSARCHLDPRADLSRAGPGVAVVGGVLLDEYVYLPRRGKYMYSTHRHRQRPAPWKSPDMLFRLAGTMP